MAIVESARPWYLSVRLGASNDKTLTKRYNLQATDETEAAAAATGVMAALANVSAGVVVGYKIEHEYVNDAYVRPTSDDAEWGEEAVIGGKLLDRPLTSWSVKIPFPKIDIFIGTAGKNRDIVDITDTAVIAYSNLFHTGNEAYVSDGEFAETLEDGRRL